MAFVPVPGGVEADLVYLCDGQRCINTLYFGGLEDVSTAELQTLGDVIKGWWNTNIKPLTSTTASLVQIDLFGLEVVNALGITYVAGLPLVGTYATGDPLPNNSTLAISFRTQLRGRSYRGRNYFIGLRSGKTHGNYIDAAIQTSFINAYAALIPLANANNTPWVVVSRRTDGADRVVGTMQPITGISVNLTLDSQRRRLPERGA